MNLRMLPTYIDMTTITVRKDDQSMVSDNTMLTMFNTPLAAMFTNMHVL